MLSLRHKFISKRPKGFPVQVTASMQICADAYYPHETLLPVLKGSRLILDLSSERGFDSDVYYQTVGTLYQGR